MEKSIKEKLARIAMEEASFAILVGNYPFGAVLTDFGGKVVETAHSTQNTDSDPTAHVEINLIRRMVKITNFIFGAESESYMNPNLNMHEVAKYTQNNLNISSGTLLSECKNQIDKARKL